MRWFQVQYWSERLDRTKGGLRLLFALSFLETAILPVPIELLMVPYILKHPRHAWLAFGAVAAGCVVASLLGYLVGLLLFDSLGRWILDVLGYDEQLLEVRRLFRRHGFGAIVLIGITPIPYHLAMFVAGALHYPLALYVLAVLVGRCGRYFAAALLTRLAGEQALELWNRHRRLAFALMVLALIVATAVSISLGNELVEG